MFTGIVQGLGQITAVVDKNNFRSYRVRLPEEARGGIMIGASIANNGCCLTVTAIHDDEVEFDIMAETLKITNLGHLSVGDYVNIERAAKFGDEIGGHVMSGHIFTTTEITNLISTTDNCTIYFRIPESIKDYILPKGFIGLNGCSLTIGDVQPDEFNVHLIPETLKRTLFGRNRISDIINIEIDAQTQAIVNTVHRILKP